MSLGMLSGTLFRGSSQTPSQLFHSKSFPCSVSAPVKRRAPFPFASQRIRDSGDVHFGKPTSGSGKILLKASAGTVSGPHSGTEQLSGCTLKQEHQQQSWWRRQGRLIGPCLLGLFIVGTWLVGEGPALAKAAAKAAAEVPASSGFSLGDALKGLLNFVLHLDKHLGEIVAQHGQATYAILFGIVFCETGLVLTPFLPGDSLLFACGALAAMGTLDFPLLLAIFITSAFLGDTVNYAAGNFFGSKALEANIIKKDFIAKTEEFYKKYGAKTVVLARFVPIVRTFAPFVAGIGSMNYTTFFLYNIGGAVLWSVMFTSAGLLFGNLPIVQKNFTLVVLAIVVVSLVPVVLEIMAARREQADSGRPAPGT